MNLLIKTSLLSLILVLTLTLNGYGQLGAWEKKSHEERATLEIKKMQQELNLSAGQANEAEKITRQKHREIDELIRNQEEDIKDRREDLLAVWQDWDKDMQQLLNDDQISSYAKLKVEFKENLFAAFDKKTGYKEVKKNKSPEANSDVKEEDLEEIEKEIKEEEDLEDALQGAEDVEFD